MPDELILDILLKLTFCKFGCKVTQPLILKFLFGH